MGKLWNFFKTNLLKFGISFLLIFIAWYPKLPSVHINHTWVYIRLEDFFILAVVAIWLLQLVFKRVKLPPKIWSVFGLYWLAVMAMRSPATQPVGTESRVIVVVPASGFTASA